MDKDFEKIGLAPLLKLRANFIASAAATQPYFTQVIMSSTPKLIEKFNQIINYR